MSYIQNCIDKFMWTKKYYAVLIAGNLTFAIVFGGWLGVPIYSLGLITGIAIGFRAAKGN